MRRVLLVLGLLLLAPRSEANRIQLFFEVDGQQTWCWNATVPCECRIRMGVWALLTGPSAGGITGFEYRIEVGLDNRPDPGWLFVETFDPGLTVLGTGALNPGDSSPRGVTGAWSSCQTGSGGMVLIETVDILNTGCNTVELGLRVARADPASNPLFQCPLFVLCDAPVYTTVCVGSSEASLNRVWPPSPPNPPPNECSVASNDCPIAAQIESWSRVKALYRD